MKHVIVDPLTRIEGHLRLELEAPEQGGYVTEALSSGTAWRGIEIVAKNRDPREVWAFVGRICGVCTSTHSLASLRAVEDALGIQIPANANSIRNIMNASIEAHDHTVHFYHLHALDFVSPIEALKADPQKTSELQETVLKTYNVSAFKAPNEGLDIEAYPKDFPKSTPAYYSAIKDKIKKIVDSGQLGIFAAQWWDHPDYKILPPEVHLMAISHYLNVLDRQSQMVTPQVVFGGKNPHPHYVVGGMPCAISMSDMNAPVNTGRLAVVDESITFAKDIVDYFYLPDLLAIGSIYAKAGVLDGGGLAKKRALSYGNYPETTYTGIQNGDFMKKCLVRSHGVVENFDQGWEKATFIPFDGPDLMDPKLITEEVEHSWYSYPEGVTNLHPSEGITDQNYTGPKVGTKTHWELLDAEKKYSWVKSPLFKDGACEVGPLAKYIVLYVKVKQGIIKDPTWAEKMMVDQIELVSKVLGVEPHVWMCTTIGRTACRGLDAQVATRHERFFFNQLIANIKAGDTTCANTDKWDPATWPKEARGVGILDAPRGALGHWVEIKNGTISNYQCIVPTTWNAMPRSIKGEHGAFESCMLDTKVAIPDKPLEVIRGIHSFDPCLACATHLYNKQGELKASELVV